MKKLINNLKRNAFYIALIVGMTALVAMVSIYNANTKTKDNVDDMELVVNDDTDDKSDKISLETDAKPINNSVKNRDKKDKLDEKSEEPTEVNTEEKTEAAKQETETAEPKKEPTDEELGLCYDGSESLTAPLVGNIIIPYNMNNTVYFETLDQYKCSPGMYIEAMEGDQVKAAYKAQVTEITCDPEFGNIMKLNLGNGFEVTYGQLLDVKATIGQVVEAGDVIATVSEPTRYYSKEGTHLYFAITKDGEPVDPELLIE